MKENVRTVDLMSNFSLFTKKISKLEGVKNPSHSGKLLKPLYFILRMLTLSRTSNKLRSTLLTLLALNLSLSLQS